MYNCQCFVILLLRLNFSSSRFEFVFDCVNGMHYKCNETSLNCGGWYIESSKWINDKKQIRKNKDSECFQYAGTFALNHKNIKTNREMISQIFC